MLNRFMITAAAAALIAGTGFANAQGTMGKEAPSAGSGMQQSAPSSPSAAPTNRERGAEQGMKSTQSEEKAGAKNQRAQDMKSGAKDEKSAQENLKGEESKSSQNEKGVAGKDMKAEGRDNNMNAGSNNAAEGRSQTVGQAGAGAKLTTEQRTRITTVIRDQHVAPVTNVNFAISVGTRVPRELGFHPLPAEIVTINPQWRGYEFFLVRDQIVVVDPRTLEIVAVLDA